MFIFYSNARTNHTFYSQVRNENNRLEAINCILTNNYKLKNLADVVLYENTNKKTSMHDNYFTLENKYWYDYIVLHYIDNSLKFGVNSLDEFLKFICDESTEDQKFKVNVKINLDQFSKNHILYCLKKGFDTEDISSKKSAAILKKFGFQIVEVTEERKVILRNIKVVNFDMDQIYRERLYFATKKEMDSLKYFINNHFVISQYESDELSLESFRGLYSNFCKIASLEAKPVNEEFLLSNYGIPFKYNSVKYLGKHPKTSLMKFTINFHHIENFLSDNLDQKKIGSENFIKLTNQYTALNKIFYLTFWRTIFGIIIYKILLLVMGFLISFFNDATNIHRMILYRDYNYPFQIVKTMKPDDESVSVVDRISGIVTVGFILFIYLIKMFYFTLMFFSRTSTKIPKVIHGIIFTVDILLLSVGRFIVLFLIWMSLVVLLFLLHIGFYSPDHLSMFIKDAWAAALLIIVYFFYLGYRRKKDSRYISLILKSYFEKLVNLHNEKRRIAKEYHLKLERENNSLIRSTINTKKNEFRLKIIDIIKMESVSPLKGSFLTSYLFKEQFSKESIDDFVHSCFSKTTISEDVLNFIADLVKLKTHHTLKNVEQINNLHASFINLLVSKNTKLISTLSEEEQNTSIVLFTKVHEMICCSNRENADSFKKLVISIVMILLEKWNNVEERAAFEKTPLIKLVKIVVDIIFRRSQTFDNELLIKFISSLCSLFFEQPKTTSIINLICSIIEKSTLLQPFNRDLENQVEPEQRHLMAKELGCDKFFRLLALKYQKDKDFESEISQFKNDIFTSVDAIFEGHRVWTLPERLFSAHSMIIDPQILLLVKNLYFVFKNPDYEINSRLFSSKRLFKNFEKSISLSYSDMKGVISLLDGQSNFHTEQLLQKVIKSNEFTHPLETKYILDFLFLFNANELSMFFKSNNINGYFVFKEMLQKKEIDIFVLYRLYENHKKDGESIVMRIKLFLESNQLSVRKWRYFLSVEPKISKNISGHKIDEFLQLVSLFDCIIRRKIDLGLIKLISNIPSFQGILANKQETKRFKFLIMQISKIMLIGSNKKTPLPTKLKLAQRCFYHLGFKIKALKEISRCLLIGSEVDRKNLPKYLQVLADKPNITHQLLIFIDQTKQLDFKSSHQIFYQQRVATGLNKVVSDLFSFFLANVNL